MASLRFREKKVLEDYLEMANGYVLNFSDRTFADFFRDFNVEIDKSPYIEGHSGSKANRMRSFWEHATDQLVGEVIQELIIYSESYRPRRGAEEVSRIVTRLQAKKPAQAKLQTTSPLDRNTRTQAAIPKQPVDIFFSYAHEDLELMEAVRQQLVVRQRLGEIVKWHDRVIPAGDEWRRQIDDMINRAHVILLFMSPHFLASRYCYEIECEIALKRHREGSALVIPIVLRACNWTVTPFGDLKALPEDGTPLTQWPDRDQVSLDVALAIMESIRGLKVSTSS